MVPVHIQLETSVLRKVLQRLHCPLEIMLVCVRWCLRNLEEMMAERGVAVDHATAHRWAMPSVSHLKQEQLPAETDPFGTV